MVRTSAPALYLGTPNRYRRNDMRRAMAVAVLGLAAVAGAAAPASAATGTGVIFSASNVYLTGGKAVVSATYRCTGGPSHLWVSAKQGPGPLHDEHSSQIARVWWQHTYENVISCDGTRHTALFPIERTKGTIHEGRAWVQVCLVIGGSETQQPDAFSSNMRYRDVVTL